MRALNAFLSLREELSARDKPLFMFEDGSVLTNNLVDSTLGYLLRDVPGKFTSHSLRIGAATTAAANNVPAAEIQKSGRWKSNRFTSYVRTAVPLTGARLYV